MCPEINGLIVWDETLRSRGIGSALIASAEQLAAGRGFACIGLGVQEDNTRAAELYQRLGYRRSTPYFDRWTYRDPYGLVNAVSDPCNFMVKDISGISGFRAPLMPVLARTPCTDHPLADRIPRSSTA